MIRNYEDRLRIVKDIHLNTGDETRHHRRDKMLELVGQQYYWKGQRRDICECVSDVLSDSRQGYKRKLVCWLWKSTQSSYYRIARSAQYCKSAMEISLTKDFGSRVQAT